ncbi:MAG: TerC family protein [Bacteroidota bacterium]
MTEIQLYGLFGIIVLLAIIIDLGVFNRKTHEVTFREALIWVIVWILLAMIFCFVVNHYKGRNKAMEFLTGYVVELSLSVDNIFVFIVIFSYFVVPKKEYHFVLYWGVLGALIMRAIFIFIGGTLINEFEWILYIFGGFLIYTGIGFFKARPDDDLVDISKNSLLRLANRWLRTHDKYEGSKFFIKKDSKWYVTPLFLVLLIVETTDLIFAVDSIPAIFGITRDMFIVYTSNVFAILGLRSMFFVLVSVIDKIRYLKKGLAVVLTFIGVKMLIEHWYKIPVNVSLVVVLSVIIFSVVLSYLIKEKKDLCSKKNTKT